MIFFLCLMAYSGCWQKSEQKPKEQADVLFDWFGFDAPINDHKQNDLAIVPIPVKFRPLMSLLLRLNDRMNLPSYTEILTELDQIS